VKPLVGVAPDFLPARGWTKLTVYDLYLRALREAGAISVVLEPEAAQIPEQLALVDGIVLPGGDDLDPALWGEEPHERHDPSDPRRTCYELALSAACVAGDVPFLGICLGMQTLNVALGGSVIQDLDQEAVRHQDLEDDLDLRHDVEVEAGSLLAACLTSGAGGAISVNSYHHQAPGRLGTGLAVSARAPDGVIEALEHPGLRYCLGVQWHPDADPGSAPIFSAFVEACAARRSAG
jgi:gamma-glutamyl-gamma-aminobutyrate hydrolase PuuD